MKGNTSVPAVAEKTELTFVEIPCRISEETNTYIHGFRQTCCNDKDGNVAD